MTVRRSNRRRQHEAQSATNERSGYALAWQRAKKAVLAQLRAQGLRVGQFSAREIALKADDYFGQHMEPLITDAAQVVATSPYFARWRCAKLLK